MPRSRTMVVICQWLNLFWLQTVSTSQWPLTWLTQCSDFSTQAQTLSRFLCMNAYEPLQSELCLKWLRITLSALIVTIFKILMMMTMIFRYYCWFHVCASVLGWCKICLEWFCSSWFVSAVRIKSFLHSSDAWMYPVISRTCVNFAVIWWTKKKP